MARRKPLKSTAYGPLVGGNLEYLLPHPGEMPLEYDLSALPPAVRRQIAADYAPWPQSAPPQLVPPVTEPILPLAELLQRLREPTQLVPPPSPVPKARPTVPLPEVRERMSPTLGGGFAPRPFVWYYGMGPQPSIDQTGTAPRADLPGGVSGYISLRELLDAIAPLPSPESIRDAATAQAFWDAARQRNLALAEEEKALGIRPNYAYTWHRPTLIDRTRMPRDFAVMSGATEAARPPASLSPLAAVPRLPAPAPQQQAPPPPDVSRFTDPEAMDPVVAELLNQGRLPDAAALAISVWNANPNDPRARAIVEKVADVAGTSDMDELGRIAKQPYSYDFGEGERLRDQPWFQDFVESHRLAAQLRALGQEVPFMPGLRPAVAANPPQTRKQARKRTGLAPPARYCCRSWHDAAATGP